MPCDRYQYLTDRINAAQLALAAYEDAEFQLGTNGVQSYTLDTGQSRQTVTQMNLTEIRNMIDSLMNRIATLYAQRDGCGTSLGVPGW